MIALAQRQNQSRLPFWRAMSRLSVLIVDDFDPWRRFVADLLERADDEFAYTFATDGLEAVRKAVELRPDIVVMDIALPWLNGIEAARQIRRVVPSSKILFMSALSDPELVRAAIRAGGRGYVLKSDAYGSLLRGMGAVLLGRYFLSSSLDDIASA
jgi:DNA-binding NarL/FixJ family response regulator